MASSIPGAVTRLLALVAGVLPNDQVIIQKENPSFETPITFQIQYVTADQNPADISAGYKREEVYDICCMLTAWAGDQDYATRITEAMAAFQLVSVALWNDPTLAGTVRFAQLKNMNLTPVPTAQGNSTCAMQFHVHCEQRIDQSI